MCRYKIIALAALITLVFGITAIDNAVAEEGKVALKPGWKVKGIYNEACASEGACPYYFGRDKEGGCRYFMVFRIQEGKVNDVDLSGITAIYMGDIPHSSFKELMELGSEGGIYISDNATREQREILDTLVVKSIGGLFMRKVFGIKYVKVDVEEEDGSIHFKMPFGEMKQYLTKGADGTPVRLDNVVFPMLTDVKACHTPFWEFEDHGRHFDYKDRCGVWADFVFGG